MATVDSLLKFDREVVCLLSSNIKANFSIKNVLKSLI
jgi:hypothetical protein